MKVFVTWDPVLEEVVCVHKSEESSYECEKCRKVKEENEKHSYWLGGDWFEVQE